MHKLVEFYLRIPSLVESTIILIFMHVQIRSFLVLVLAFLAAVLLPLGGKALQGEEVGGPKAIRPKGKALPMPCC